MRARIATRLLLGLLAVWGATAALALLAGELRWGHDRSHAPHAPSQPGPDSAPADPPTEGGRGAPSSVTAPDAPAPASNTPAVPWTRHRVCTASGPVRLLRVPAAPRPRYVVHCGATVTLIGFDAFGERIEPRRIAEFTVSVPEPGLGAEPGGLASGDLDADGVGDLLIGSVLRDDRETRSGGRLHWIRGAADGSFASVRRLGDAAAAEIVFVQDAAGTTRGLAALHEAEGRLGEPAQLWFYAPGAAPERRHRLDVGPQARALQAVGLDADGRGELFALLGEPPGLHRLILDAPPSQALQAVELREQAARELSAGDLDGDGRLELLVLGAKLTLLSAGEVGARSERVLFDASTLRDLQLANVVGDDRLDLVAYAHPDLVAFEQMGDGTFARRDLYRRRSAQLGTLALRADHLDDDPEPELLLFGASESEPGVVELVVISDLTRFEQLATTSLPLADAPLVLRATLP